MLLGGGFGGLSVVTYEKRSSLQPRPQGLLAFQYGGGKRKDPGDKVGVLCFG